MFFGVSQGNSCCRTHCRQSVSWPDVFFSFPAYTHARLSAFVRGFLTQIMQTAFPLSANLTSSVCLSLGAKRWRCSGGIFFLSSPQQNWTDSEATVVNYFLCFVNIIICIIYQGQRVMGKVFLYDNLLPWGLFKLLNSRYRGFRISTAVSLALHLLFCRSLFPHFCLLSLYQSHHTIFSPSLDFFLAALAPRCVYATSPTLGFISVFCRTLRENVGKNSCAVNVRSCFWAARNAMKTDKPPSAPLKDIQSKHIKCDAQRYGTHRRKRTNPQGWWGHFHKLLSGGILEGKC